MAQRFVIDRTGGAAAGQSGYCIPYSITSPSTLPLSGKISLVSPSNTSDVSKIESIRISYSTDLNYDISSYLTSSNAGNLILFEKNDPDKYAIFNYYSTINSYFN